MRFPGQGGGGCRTIRRQRRGSPPVSAGPARSGRSRPALRAAAVFADDEGARGPLLVLDCASGGPFRVPGAPGVRSARRSLENTARSTRGRVRRTRASSSLKSHLEMFAARPVLQMTDAETPGDLSEVPWLVTELRCPSGRRGRGGFVPRTSRFNANGLTRLHRLRGPFPGALAALAASAMPQGLSPVPGLAELLKTTCAASGVAGRRVRGVQASGVTGRRAWRAGVRGGGSPGAASRDAPRLAPQASRSSANRRGTNCADLFLA